MTIFPFTFYNSVLFMSRYLSFISVSLILLIVSCQKEGSFEQGKTSKGSLQNSAGDCLSKKVAGTYTATKSLGDSNYIDVTVDVTGAGHYTVFTDTVNGYFFKGSGTFTTIGSNTVRLNGFGTPGSAGANDFTVFFDSSFCSVGVTVLPNSGSSGGTAVYTFQSSGTSCMTATPSGTFTQGTALTSANKVSIPVNVTTTGTWSIITSTVAGFLFSGSGTFTAAGAQTITLTASGTPNASGPQSFPVTVGTTSCSFTITVNPGSTPTNPPPNTGDYFPRTVGSHWTYMFDGDPTDTIRRYVIPQTKTISGNVYNIFMVDDGASVDTSGYYRKSGGDYIQWADVSYDFDFDNSIFADIIILKDNQPKDYSWTTNAFAGTIGGTAATGREKYTIAQKDVTITSNGIQYPNTIVLKYEIQYQAGTTWINVPGYYLISFTKNYGITKIEIYDGTNALTDKLELKTYQVF